MCGHVGIAGKGEFKDEGTMKRLLVFDYFRGMDSTGLAVVRNNGETKIAKMASHPLDLMEMPKFKDALSGWNSKVFIGHNRAATKGVVNNYNAHPYEFDHIIGAHNGTLDQSSWTAIENALGEKFPVDSMAVIAAISKMGIEETVKLLQGAWALVWYDASNNTINFLRNKERPFWYSYTKTFDKVLWASEWPMIHAAVNMAPAANSYDLFQDKDGFRFFPTKEDWWYRFELSELAAGGTERPKPHVKELKGKAPAPAVTYTCGAQSPFRRVSPGGQTTTSTTSSQTSSSGAGSTGSSQGSNVIVHPSVTKVNDKVTVLHVQTDTTDPLGGYVGKAEFEAMAKYGCSYCHADVEYEDKGISVLLPQEKVLCAACADADGGTSRIYTTQELSLAS